MQPAVVQPLAAPFITTAPSATTLVKTAASVQPAAAVNHAPTAVNDGPFTVTNNTPLTLTAAQLVGNDIPPNTGDKLGVSWVGSAYNGTAVLNANGTVTFTPTTGYTGTTSFVYNDIDTTNGYTSPNFATVSLTVTGATNQAPTAVNDGPFTVTNNTPLTLTAAQLVGNDTTPNTGSVLGVSSVSAATNGTAVLNANGTVTFTPTTGYAGAASFGYKVKDQTGAISTNTATVSLTVTAATNQAPTAVNDGPFTVTNNTPLTLTAAQLVGNDIPPNTGDKLGVSWVGSAYNGTAVLNANGTVTFTPTTGYTGTTSFVYNDIDTTNGYTSPNFATVSLTVTGATNQAPTAVNDGPFTVTNNTPLTLTAAQLVGNDTTPNTGSVLGVSSVSAATNGTAVLNANGTVTFTPTTGYAGAASFGYKVKDQTGAISTNTATVSLTVSRATNQAPTAVNDGPFTVTNNTPLTLTAAQLVGNDIPPNTGDKLGVSWVGSAYNGTAVLNANGTVTFTPTTGYTGTTSFVYNDIDTTNGYTSPNFATVSLTVTGATNQAPTAVNDGPFTVTNNTPLTLTAAQLVGNDTTPNTGGVLSVSSVSAATNGTAVLNANGTVTFTPTTGYAGAASFGYKVKDTTGAISTNTATVSLTVSRGDQSSPHRRQRRTLHRHQQHPTDPDRRPIGRQRHHPQHRRRPRRQLRQRRNQRHRGPQRQRHRHLHPHHRLRRRRSFGYKVKDQTGAISTNTATVSLTVSQATTAPLINTSNTAVGLADSNLYGETPAQINASLDAMHAMGVNEVRILIPWAGIEPIQGADYYATMDYVVNAANQRGMAILGVLNSTPSWAIPAGSPIYSTPPTSDAAFASFAAAVATRYAGQISAYEVWNEPNSFGFWSPTPDAAAYTRLLQAAYPAIKAADPNATVIAAGLISLATYGNLTINPIDFLTQMYQAGARGYFDAVAIHPYQYTLYFSQGGPYGDAAPINQVAAMHAVMVANGDGNKLIWSTEYGEPSSQFGDAIQASAIQDYLTAWSQFSYTGPSFIYTTVDTNSASTNPDDTLGVVRSDWTWKPAAYTIQQWIAAHPQQAVTAQVMTALALTTSGAVLAVNSGSTYAVSCAFVTSVQNACTVT